MDQHRALHSGYLVSGVRTPPIRRNSKLASLGRIFKPWKWRKKKNDKLKPPVAVEKKAAARQKKDDLVKRSPEESERGARAKTHMHLHIHTHTQLLQKLLYKCDPVLISKKEETWADFSMLKNYLVTMVGSVWGSPPGGHPPLVNACLSHVGAPPVRVKKSPATLPRNFTLPKDPHGSLLRGRISTPSGSPHLGVLHPQLPPSCIIEELHRTLATKHRQDSFQNKEARSSPKRRLDARLSRTVSTERETPGESQSKKESDENKENWRLDEYLSDPDSWNESVISGTLPRRMRKELLAVKLRNRPSKQELEDRNIFPVRSDQERQEIRQQIEMKLAKRLSQRPAVEELESRNILKQRNDQTEQEERREIKQRLNRKLNQRPTVDELRDRKILIRFSDYVEVAKAQDYDRRADKPWTRLSAADKAAIRKELNEFKSTEMEVHTSSKHLTRSASLLASPFTTVCKRTDDEDLSFFYATALL
uniref:Phosphatase and actin regulator n=1 Tax=Gouania willdenowi TaxID=441366 RepID=A0A8C5GMF9_GOUWI